MLLLGLLLYVVYTKQHVDPWNKSPLLGLVLLGTVLVCILKKQELEPFSATDIEKQTGKIMQLNETLESKVTLTKAVVDQLETRITKTADNLSTFQANKGIAKEAQKLA